MELSYVVTGGGRGIGRAIVERMVRRGHAVVVVEKEGGGLGWGAELVTVVEGDAGVEEVVEEAADCAQRVGILSGWVNNAAIFRDASLDRSGAGEVLELIDANLRPVVVGCGAAVRRFLAAESGGSIVNISSHQAVRAVPGALPYSTAKAAIEGLTRALAVEYGPRGIRVNAVAPGSVATERYTEYLESLDPADAAAVEAQMAVLHPMGRVATSDEVAAAVEFLLSAEAGFVNGATVPVDGGRSVLALDPEAR
ncbi:SDR family NAD(P)-dependent oxidoreductase [Nocardia sp. CDC160]|uniref:SDR family NAD(P)-dependent oxidoreductase n=1 Tax=Nocardia sp. CDC160 TaxID=3112166 RepID=UPI002DBF011B|nr:SDR family oxidoreductase [Nocardia sp. CDC160]MEC3915824.1 SDR family oxidoreductase [Nocardia sp. CDC160]